MRRKSFDQPYNICLLFQLKIYTNTNNDLFLPKKYIRSVFLKVYGRKSMHEVNKILQNENIDYIILEDSICLAPSTGCSTNDIIDITNGEKIDSDLSEAGK